MIVNIKDHPALAAFLRRAFPAYRKHKAIIHPTTSVTLSGGYWDGGSRSTYSGFTLQGVECPLKYNSAPPQFNGGAPDRIAVLDPDFVVLESGTFCGKPATVTIFALPETLATLGV